MDGVLFSLVTLFKVVMAQRHAIELYNTVWGLSSSIHPLTLSPRSHSETQGDLQ